MGFTRLRSPSALNRWPTTKRRSPASGQRYLSQVEATIARVCESPQLYRIDRGHYWLSRL